MTGFLIAYVIEVLVLVYGIYLVYKVDKGNGNVADYVMDGVVALVCIFGGGFALISTLLTHMIALS